MGVMKPYGYDFTVDEKDLKDKSVQSRFLKDDFKILSYDFSSLMSGKIHALLCRSYVKSRDWYDFSWYKK